jgi:hypothetical protein
MQLITDFLRYGGTAELPEEVVEMITEYLKEEEFRNPFSKSLSEMPLRSSETETFNFNTDTWKIWIREMRYGKNTWNDWIREILRGNTHTWNNLIGNMNPHTWEKSIRDILGGNTHTWKNLIRTMRGGNRILYNTFLSHYDDPKHIWLYQVIKPHGPPHFTMKGLVELAETRDDPEEPQFTYALIYLTKWYMNMDFQKFPGRKFIAPPPVNGRLALKQGFPNWTIVPEPNREIRAGRDVLIPKSDIPDFLTPIADAVRNT